MAKNYNDIYTAVYTKGNKMDFTNSMIRGNGIPLDVTEVYNSYAAAESYVNSNPVAYEGQILAVTENNDTTVYVIAPRLGTDGATVEHYLKEVGSIPDVDGKTIIINEAGQLEAVIPDYVDTNTTYTLEVTRQDPTEEEPDIDAGVVITFKSSDSSVEDVSYLIPDTDLSEYVTLTKLNETVSGLNTTIGEKANVADVYTKNDVYTKTETDTKIGEMVAAADHLKRVIVDDKDDININAANADQFIYMVPSGLTANDNKYYEYIVIIEKNEADEEVNRYLEQVGNWEVDLGDYLKSADAASTYVSSTTAENTYAKKTDLDEYAKSADVSSTYVSNDSLSTTLAEYAKSSDIPTDYVSESELTTELANYDTSAVANGKYVAKEEGKSLIADSEIERLAKINENAQVNAIDSVSEKFTILDKKLDLAAVPQVLVTGLMKTNWTVETTTDDEGQEVNNFVAASVSASLEDILKPATYDAEIQTGSSGLMTAEQVQKLQALVIGDEGGVEISGTVNADNVTGLGAWITNNRDKVEGLYPVTAVNLLNTLDSTINAEETGLVAQLSVVQGKVGALETKVADLEDLTTSHNEDIAALKAALTWTPIAESQV